MAGGVCPSAYDDSTVALVSLLIQDVVTELCKCLEELEAVVGLLRRPANGAGFTLYP